MSALDDLAHGRRELFEYWGHAACFLPIDLYPLMRWRMENQRAAWARLSRKQTEFIEAVYREVAERGPLSAGEISIGGQEHRPVVGLVRRQGGARTAVPPGTRRVAGRRHFERLYDIPERVLPSRRARRAAGRGGRREEGAARARRARDGRRHREGHRAVLPRRRVVGSPVGRTDAARRRTTQRAVRRARRGRPPRAGPRRGLEAAGLRRARRAASRDRSTRARSCRRSIP